MSLHICFQRFLPRTGPGNILFSTYCIFCRFPLIIPPQRTFLKDPSTKTNIPIQAIGLSLYESLPTTTAEQLGTQVIRTQWLFVLLLAVWPILVLAKY